MKLFEDLSYSSVANLAFNILGQIFKQPSPAEPSLLLPLEVLSTQGQFLYFLMPRLDHFTQPGGNLFISCVCSQNIHSHDFIF